MEPQIRDEPRLSPIQKLPLEILQHIMALSVPSITDNLYHKDKWTVPLEPGEPHPDSVIETLWEVSYYWRDALRTTPEVWSTIILDDLHTSRSSKFGRCISLSKQRPLDIYIAPCGLYVNRTIMALFRRCAKRIKRLYLAIRFSFSPRDPFLVGLLDHLQTDGPFPALSALCVNANSEADIPLLQTSQLDLPNLQSLMLGSFTRDIFRLTTTMTWSSIRRLCLEFHYAAPGRTDGLTYLSQCANLDHLRITLPCYPIMPINTPMLLPSLTYLRLRARNDEGGSSLLQALWLPQLHHFSLQYEYFLERFNPVATLDALLKVRANNLQRLSISGLILDGTSLQSQFANLPDLTRLEIHNCKIRVPFFQTFAVEDEFHKMECLLISQSSFDIIDMTNLLAVWDLERPQGQSKPSVELRPKRKKDPNSGLYETIQSRHPHIVKLLDQTQSIPPGHIGPVSSLFGLRSYRIRGGLQPAQM